MFFWWFLSPSWSNSFQAFFFSIFAGILNHKFRVTTRGTFRNSYFWPMRAIAGMFIIITFYRSRATQPRPLAPLPTYHVTIRVKSPKNKFQSVQFQDTVVTWRGRTTGPHNFVLLKLVMRMLHLSTQEASNFMSQKKSQCSL